MYGTLSLPKLHTEYHHWMSELEFAREEIILFEKHLCTMVGNNFISELAAQVEQYQNRFIRHQEVIDQLQHDLHLTETRLAANLSEISGMGVEHIQMNNHGKLRELMHTFRNLYREQQQKFRSFEAKWY